MGVVGLVCIARGELYCKRMHVAGKCIVIWWCSGLKLYCNKEVGCSAIVLQGCAVE